MASATLERDGRFVPKVCAVAGCEREHHANGWCRLHWRRERESGTPQPDRPLRGEVVDGAKWCCGCDTLKPLAAFARCASRRDGRNGYCRDCVGAWRRANTELRRAAHWAREANKRAAEGVATAEQIEARIAYYGGRCWMCGDSATQLDHVKPLAHGGSNWPANLRPACAPCNIRKRDRWPYAA